MKWQRLFGLILPTRDVRAVSLLRFNHVLFHFRLRSSDNYSCEQRYVFRNPKRSILTFRSGDRPQEGTNVLTMDCENTLVFCIQDCITLTGKLSRNRPNTSFEPHIYIINPTSTMRPSGSWPQYTSVRSSDL